MPKKISKSKGPSLNLLGYSADNPNVETSNLIRVATRLETVPLGEPLYSKYPSMLKRPAKDKPFIDLRFNAARIVQIRVPMRIKVYKNENGVREKTQITLLAANDMSIELEDLKPNNSNLEDLDKEGEKGAPVKPITEKQPPKEAEKRAREFLKEIMGYRMPN